MSSDTKDIGSAARRGHNWAMAEKYHVQADWDAEARVWVSTTNIPGLVVEADTLPEFIALVNELAPDLLRENAGIAGPVPVELKASGTLELAAAS